MMRRTGSTRKGARGRGDGRRTRWDTRGARGSKLTGRPGRTQGKGKQREVSAGEQAYLGKRKGWNGGV